MTIARYFRISSYCTAAAGFLAVAATGKIGPIVGLLFSAVFAASALMDTARLRRKVPTWSLNLLATGCLLFFCADWWMLSQSLPRAAVHLLLLFAAMKLLTLSNDRDHLQLYFIGLAEVLVSCTLSANLIYGITLAIFLPCSVSTLVLFEMRRSNARMRSAASVKPLVNRGDHPGTELELFEPFPAGLFLATTLGTAFLILAVAVPLFLILPRVARGPHKQPSGAAQFLSGFSDRVELGRIGTLKLSDAVVMRVKTDRPASELPANLRWRGLALDHFDGKSWRCTDRKRTAIPTQGGFYKLEDSTQGTDWLNQTFFVEALSADVIFAARKALAISRDAGVLRRDSAENLHGSGVGSQKLRYTVISDLIRPDPTNIVDFAPIPEAILNRYLQLPYRNQRVADLAERVTGGCSTRYAKALALEMHLRSNYRYSLRLRGAAQGKDPVAAFLFDAKKGHCEYFASAMTVMLRQIGIPARLVNGFRSGEYNPIGGNRIVRQRHAHSWVEAYFPPYGWVEFDPTPPDPVSAKRGIALFVSNLADALDLWWWEGVVNFDSSKQYKLMNDLQAGLEKCRAGTQRFFAEAYSRCRTVASAVDAFSLRPGRQGKWLVFLLVAAAALPLIRGWRRAISHLRFLLYRQRAREAAIYFYREALAALKDEGFRVERGQTPMEFAASLQGHPAGSSLLSLTILYNAMRFGPAENSFNPAEAEAQLQYLRSSLRASRNLSRSLSGP
jgi:hypothetical protein